MFGCADRLVRPLHNSSAHYFTPKKQELIASPYRFDGGKEEAREYFEQGFGRAFEKIRSTHNPAYPLTIYYAFKQSESEDEEDGNGDTKSHRRAGKPCSKDS